jgi:hypothetical protein
VLTFQTIGVEQGLQEHYLTSTGMDIDEKTPVDSHGRPDLDGVQGVVGSISCRSRTLSGESPMMAGVVPA